jgi:hypothetical protein
VRSLLFPCFSFSFAVRSPESPSVEAFFAAITVRLDALEDRLAPAFVDTAAQFRRNRESSTDTIVETRSSPETGGGTVGAAEVPQAALLRLLHQLRQLVHEEEHACLLIADDTSSHGINQARYVFEARAKAVHARLVSWEKKHVDALMTGEGPELPSTLALKEPEYFGESAYAVPLGGSSVLLRDGELSSLIALTLSADSFKEASSAPIGTSRVVTPTSHNAHLPEGGPRHPSAQRKTIPSMWLDPLAALPPLASLSVSPPVHSPLTQGSGDLDPDDPQTDFTSLVKVTDVVVKSIKPPPTGSLFRSFLRPAQASEAMASPVATPPIDSGAFFEETVPNKRFSRASDKTVLDILSKKEATPSTTRGKTAPPARGVPTFMAKVGGRREGSSLSTLSDVCAVAGTPRSATPQPQSAAGTIRSIPSLQSLSSGNEQLSLPSVFSSASSSASSDAASLLSQSLSSSEMGHHDEQHDAVSPLAPGGSSRLLGGLFASGLDSMRSMAEGKSPRLGAVSDRSDGGAGSTAHEHIKLSTSTISLSVFLFSLPSPFTSARLASPLLFARVTDLDLIFAEFRQGDKEYRVTAFFARRFEKLRRSCGLSEEL